jgi:hypothetical protein
MLTVLVLDGYFQLQRTSKEARRCCKEEEREAETQAQTVTLGLEQITKFIYHLYVPLGDGNILRSNSECA